MARSASVLFFHAPVRSLCQHFPASPLLDLRALIDLAQLMGLFVLQLVIALETACRQPARLDRLTHGATWLQTVTAVAKAAVARERFNVGERAAHRLDRVPELQLSHA